MTTEYGTYRSVHLKNYVCSEKVYTQKYNNTNKITTNAIFKCYEQESMIYFLKKLWS